MSKISFEDLFPSLSKFHYCNNDASGKVKITFHNQQKLEIKGPFQDRTIELFGPFIKSTGKEEPSFLIFLPDYILRQVHSTSSFELIPIQPYLIQKITIIFSTNDELQKWKSMCENVYQAAKFLSYNSSFPSDLQYQIKIPHLSSLNSGFIKLSQLGFEIEESRNSFNVNFSIDLHMSTTIEDPLTPDDKKHMSLLIHKSQVSKSITRVFFQSFDNFSIVYCTLFARLNEIRAPLLSFKTGPKISVDFPPIDCDFISHPIPYIDHQNDYCDRNNQQITLDEKFPTVNFSSYNFYPSSTTTHLKILDFSYPIRRTIIFPDSAPKKLIQRNVQDRLEELDHKEVFKSEIGNLIKQDEGKNIIESISLPTGLPSFYFRSDHSKAYFSKDGSDLLALSFVDPKVSHQFDPYISKIKLNLTHSPNFFIGSDASKFLHKLVWSFNTNGKQEQTHKLNLTDPRFNDLINFFVEVLFDGLIQAPLLSMFLEIFQNCPDHTVLSCFPIQNSPFFMHIFFERLIVSQKLTSFFEYVASSAKWRANYYSCTALINSDLFIQCLLTSAKLLSSTFYTFTGHYIPSTSSNIPNPIRPERYDFLIAEDVQDLKKAERKSLDTHPIIFRIISHIIQFLKVGFLFTDSKDYSIWPLFKHANDLNLNELPLVLFKTAVSKAETQDPEIKVANIILFGMKASMMHNWLFYIALISQNYNTHQSNSPILDYESLMITTENLLSITSIKINIEEDELHQSSYMF